ncbi:MAG: NUDIX hydrolase [Chloroflexi bacterium]|nr:NUDIX hydrolase [Chloroflexota bacterium]
MSLKPIYAEYDWQKEGNEVYRFCPFCGTRLGMKEVDFRERPSCSQCHFIHYKNPAPGVSVFAVKEEQVLLGERKNDFGVGKWALPSGYIEFDEDFLTAAIREVKEETGLDAAIQAIIHVESGFVSPRFHFFTVYLLAEIVSGELKAGDDATAVAWFPLSGPLPEMAFEPDVTIITQYAAGQLAQFPIDPAYARGGVKYEFC